MKVITEEKLKKYFEVTGKALKKVKIVSGYKKINSKNIADDFFDMASRYYRDAKYFYEKKDFVNAFAALNYAHGWLDAGARLGIFDVDKDSTLFTVD